MDDWKKHDLKLLGVFIVILIILHATIPVLVKYAVCAWLGWC